eukprot:TRINITY_DN31273_c0_g1_i1.p1 TRINITY_DN31273_c0_g1~~TRINITY_DN31273_c0_g1_i1.p1  ORF type:complete len:184 (+),score=11.27 TRINITY_DN31273_c0_g1_i1:53-604(+)
MADFSTLVTFLKELRYFASCGSEDCPYQWDPCGVRAGGFSAFRKILCYVLHCYDRRLAFEFRKDFGLNCSDLEFVAGLKKVVLPLVDPEPLLYCGFPAREKIRIVIETCKEILELLHRLPFPPGAFDFNLHLTRVNLKFIKLCRAREPMPLHDILPQPLKQPYAVALASGIDLAVLEKYSAKR